MRIPSVTVPELQKYFKIQEARKRIIITYELRVLYLFDILCVPILLSPRY